MDVPKRSETGLKPSETVLHLYTFVWKFVDVPKRSETGLKPFETVGKQLSADPTFVWIFARIPRGLKQV